MLSIATANLSCAPELDAGANIAIALSPEKAFIVPGAGISCISAAAAKVAGESLPTSDLSEHRALYTNFKLQWKSPGALNISALKVTIKGFGIEGESQEITFSEEEIKALLGLEGGRIDALSTRTASAPTEINSSSSDNKGTASPYAPCGFHVSGISVKENVKSFTAQLKVEIVGYETKADGSQAPVRQSATARAQAF